MTEERFWLLAGLKLSNEAEPAELAELELFLAEHPDMRMRLATMQATWASPVKVNDERKEAAFNKHMQRLSNHFSESVLQYESADVSELVPAVPEKVKSSGRRVTLWVMGIAASLLAIVWFTVFYSPGRNAAGGNKAQNTVSTKRGSKSKIQLPDGTQVWLNADSKITYNENFQGKLREVQLSGEAFFDVVRDESRPFIIHTNVIDVKVLGTAFNVRSYANEKNTETSLIRGSVEITLRNSPDKKFTLKPNDKLVVQNEEPVVVVDKPVKGKVANNQILLTWEKINFRKTDTIAMEALWVKNKLAFDEETLEEIALKIERWYDVKVTITDERIRRVEYSGVFEDESLKQVMEALRISGNFKYAINKKEVTIRP